MTSLEDQIDLIIHELNKRDLGATVLSDESSPCVVTGFLSTGCLVLDAIMGGGLPIGRITEIYGDTSSGKTLIAEQACATVQDEGGVAVYVDTEAAVSLPLMRAVGVDIDKLVYIAPDTVEQVFQVMEAVVDNKGEEDLLVVWDSVAATSSLSEMDKDTGETGYLTQARVISQGLRKLTRQIAKKRVAVLFLNQAKTAIGVMFGDNVATFGGKAVGFHSSIRVQMKVGPKIKRSKRVIGIHARARVTKNKVAPPFREAVLPIFFGHGIDDGLATFEFLKDAGEMTSAGSYYQLTLDKEDLRFQRRQWLDIFDEHYDAICDLVDNVYREEDLL